MGALEWLKDVGRRGLGRTGWALLMISYKRKKKPLL